MPDISMCLNKECPLKNECYRYMATPSEYRQSYCGFKFELVDGKPECDNYWPATATILRG